jgi:hypothetical protein
VSGSDGRFGYSSTDNVGRVNFELPLVTKTREPSKVKVIGLFGREREISANSFPGTKTLPAVLISAGKCALLAVSKSEADKKTSLLIASMTIPSSSVFIGRVDNDRETQLTPSVKAACSTINFIFTL